MTTPKLFLKNISKRYGENFLANSNVNFELVRGEVHALVGENGAGKTTLMKILFGLEAPSAGEIFKDGAKIEITSPIDAKHHRIGMVHQHFMLEDRLAIKDHLQIEINAIEKTWGFSSLNKRQQEIEELAAKLNLNVPLKTLIGRLTVVQKQKVEILKTLLFNPEVLIFDEPTAVLPPDEVATFYRLIADLKGQGRSMILITHKIADVITHADRVTVLRHGEVRFCAASKATTERELARHMIGADLSEASTLSTASAHFKIADSARAPLLEIENFSLSPKSKDERSTEDLESVSLKVCHGEIIALAGVEGNGQNALISYLIRPETLAEKIADDHIAKGEIELLETQILEDGRVTASDAEIRRLALGFIGPDRLHDSAVLDYDIKNHFRLLPHYRAEKFLKHVDENVVSQTLDDLDVRPKRSDLKLGEYSGGNQQKWVVGRETSHLPELLIACHPTRGVDFAAAERIHGILREIKNRNRGVVMLSSDIDEILKLSDRILVFFEGRVCAEFAAPFDRAEIGRAFGGAASHKGAPP